MNFLTQNNSSRQRLGKLLLLLLTIPILFIACQPSTNVVAGVKPVQVLILDDAEQVPLSRVKVTLTLPNNVFPMEDSDNSGRAVFNVREDLLTLTATYLIQKEGYQSQKHTVTLNLAPVLTVYLVRIDATAVSRETPSATPVPPTPKPNDTATPLPTAIATLTSTPIPPTPTFAHTPTPSPSIEDDLTLIRREGADTVFVLAGPDVSNVQLGTLGADETAEIIGRTEQNEWLQIITDRGIEGWVAYCEVILSVPNLEDVPITWNGSVTPKLCRDIASGTSVPPTGNCVNVTLSRTDWPGKEFDDVLLSWSNVPSTATQLKLSVSGPTNDSGTDYVVDPTFSDTGTGYKVELFMFEDGDFKPGATYTYVVQPVNTSGGIICTTQGTFIP